MVGDTEGQLVCSSGFYLAHSLYLPHMWTYMLTSTHIHVHTCIHVHTNYLDKLSVSVIILHCHSWFCIDHHVKSPLHRVLYNLKHLITT